MWCNSQQFESNYPLNEWETYFTNYDFVFYLPLRHVDPSITNVKDMICNNIFETGSISQKTASFVLSSDEYQCFIILDGLDEWNPRQSTIRKLRYKGFPNIDNMSSCTVLTTTRPWKLLNAEVERNPLVIEVLGLEDDGINVLIENVFVNYHKMNPDAVEFRTKRNEIAKKLKNETFRSILKIPMLTVVCAQKWYDDKEIWNGMTSFFSNLTDMLIQRAISKCEFKIEDRNFSNCLVNILREKENIKAYLTPLLKLGKVAFDALFENGNLVVEEKKFKNQLGDAVFKFVLEVGLISLKEARSIDTRNVSVHFIDKSVQEFLAAIHIVTYQKGIEIFCKHILDINAIMKLSNVISFIYGMCPSFNSVVSQRVASVIGKDIAIVQYRASPLEHTDVAFKIYNNQEVTWYNELLHGMAYSSESNFPLTYHISCVHLAESSDIETLETTKLLLLDDRVYITSLWLGEGQGHSCITNRELLAFLSNEQKTRSLVLLCINGKGIQRSICTIYGPKLKTLCLLNVTVQAQAISHSIIKGMDVIKKIYMKNIDFGDGDIGLVKHMSALREVILEEVSMKRFNWSKFMQSLSDIGNSFKVKMNHTNIDNISVSKILSSSNFAVTKNCFENHGIYLEFSRISSQSKADKKQDLLANDFTHEQLQTEKYHIQEKLRKALHLSLYERDKNEKIYQFIINKPELLELPKTTKALNKVYELQKLATVFLNDFDIQGSLEILKEFKINILSLEVGKIKIDSILEYRSIEYEESLTRKKNMSLKNLKADKHEKHISLGADIKLDLLKILKKIETFGKIIEEALESSKDIMRALKGILKESISIDIAKKTDSKKINEIIDELESVREIINELRKKES